MTRQDLAEFYKISTQAVGRWSKDRKHLKTVQALAGAEQEIVDLIGAINKLAYIYNCKWLHGISQLRWCWVNCGTVVLECNFFEKEQEFSTDTLKASLHALDVIEQLQVIKTKLEELVYGVSSVD